MTAPANVFEPRPKAFPRGGIFGRAATGAMDTALDEDDVDAALAAAEERVARLKKLKAARERARAAGDSGACAPPPRDEDEGGRRGGC